MKGINRKNEFEGGAALVQFALVFPILMLILVFMVDIARFLLIQTLLNKSAEDGLIIARTIANLDIDIRGKSDTDVEYLWYVDARRRVILAATSLPLSTLFSPTVNAGTDTALLNFEYTDLGVGPVNGSPTYNYGAVFLRPGERVYDPLRAQWIDHATLPNNGVAATQSPEQLLSYHPIQVEVWGRIRFMTPFLGERFVRGRAMGPRELSVPHAPLAPLPGEPDPPYEVTSTTTSTTTTTRESTTTTTIPCLVNWSTCLIQAVNVGGGRASCPIPATVPAVCTCTACSDLDVVNSW